MNLQRLQEASVAALLFLGSLALVESFANGARAQTCENNAECPSRTNDPCDFCQDQGGYGVCVDANVQSSCPPATACRSYSCGLTNHQGYANGPACNPIQVANGTSCPRGNGQTGFCSSGNCVGCASDANCLNGQFCNNGNCVQCRTAADCGFQDQCYEIQCISGACQNLGARGYGSCANDNNSCTNDVCFCTDQDVNTGNCNAAECTHPAANQGQACGNGGTCNGGSCSAPACSGPAQCNDNNPCTSNQCNGGVCGNPAIASGQPCEGQSGRCNSGGQCVQCTHDAHCPGGQSCSNGSCVVCDGTHPCPNGAQCNNNQCVQCTASSQCGGPTPFCVNNRCVVCQSADNCNDGNACTQDLCTDGNCQRNPITDGASCGDDGNGCTRDICGSGNCTHPAAENAPCNGGFCTAQSTCVPCTGPGQCPAGQQCNNQQCVTIQMGCTSPSQCEDNNPCTSNQCNNGQCAFAAVGINPRVTCPTASATGVCASNGVCVGCIENTDCSGSATCVSGQCVGCVLSTECPDDGNPCTVEACINRQCSRATRTGCVSDASTLDGSVGDAGPIDGGVTQDSATARDAGVDAGRRRAPPEECGCRMHLQSQRSFAVPLFAVGILCFSRSLSRRRRGRARKEL